MDVYVLFYEGDCHEPAYPFAVYTTRGEAIAEAYLQAQHGLILLMKRLTIGWPCNQLGGTPAWT